MPLNVAKILNEGHKDEFDVATEGMTLMSLVEAMGIASKRGLVEGMTHGEAGDLLGEKLTVFFKEKTGMARYVDMVLFARIMIAKGEGREQQPHELAFVQQKIYGNTQQVVGS